MYLYPAPAIIVIDISPFWCSSNNMPGLSLNFYETERSPTLKYSAFLDQKIGIFIASLKLLVQLLKQI